MWRFSPGENNSREDHSAPGARRSRLLGGESPPSAELATLLSTPSAYRKGRIQLTEAEVEVLNFNGDGQFAKADVDASAQLYDL